MQAGSPGEVAASPGWSRDYRPIVVKLAVKVADPDAGAVTVWLMAPASDQFAKV